jgi:hypothetical protein
VLGIVNSEIIKETDQNVQKEIDINTEVLGIVNSEGVNRFLKIVIIVEVIFL